MARGQQLIAQQAQPIAQPPLAQQLLEVRRIAAACGAGSQPPQAGRAEAQDDQLPLAGQHPVGFAHQRLRIGVEL